MQQLWHTTQKFSYLQMVFWCHKILLSTVCLKYMCDHRNPERGPMFQMGSTGKMMKGRCVVDFIALINPSPWAGLSSRMLGVITRTRTITPPRWLVAQISTAPLPIVLSVVYTHSDGTKIHHWKLLSFGSRTLLSCTSRKKTVAKMHSTVVITFFSYLNLWCFMWP
jgi:hypothetical protein